MTKLNKKPRIAIIHDFLIYPGGAEKVLEVFCELFPDATIFTLVYDKHNMKNVFEDKEIKTSFLNSWPKFFKKRPKFLLPFLSSAAESIDFRDYDLIISSSSAWSKGIVTRLNTKHVAYIHSPMRYVWDENEKYLRNLVGKNNFFVRQLLSYLRVWDYEAAQRPDLLIANSKYTNSRIKKYYRRDSEIIYPPVFVELDKFESNNDNDNNHIKDNKDKSFVVISRLSRYKNVELAIQVFNKLELPLIVIGDGKEYKKLKKISGSTIVMKGWISEKEKIEILKNSRALVFPCEDDFGMVNVEALACGVPVIALGRGGAQEIVREGIDGILFHAPTVEVMSDGIRRFLINEENFNREELIQRAKSFSKEKFKDSILECVNKVI